MDLELKEQLGTLRTQLEQHIDGKLKPISDWQAKKDQDDKENQKVIDNFQKRLQAVDLPGGENKSFGGFVSEQIAEAFGKKQSEFKSFSNDKNASLSIEVKSPATMLIGTHLTGDTQASYNSRQGIIPSAKINFRDLIPTVRPATGTYVTYRETGGEGEVGVQTEGSLKSELDYKFTEVKVVADYVAGWTTFSKQMMLNLPWLQSTLMRLLMRDFLKKENTLFYSIVAANATGYDETGETSNVKGLIDFLMGRADSDYNNSFVIVKNTEKGELLKLMFESGYYAGSGSVVGMPDGTVRIADTPIIGASWATAGKVMIIDNDFLERVEGESLRVEFSFENEDNFKKNLVTARVECFEDLNLLRPDAHTYTDSPANSGS